MAAGASCHRRLWMPKPPAQTPAGARLPTPHGDAVMLLALLSSLVEARSMGSEVREAAVRVGKRRKTCIGRPFVTVLQARQRHARTPAPWVHAGTRAAGTLRLALPCAKASSRLSSAKHAPSVTEIREIKGLCRFLGPREVKSRSLCVLDTRTRQRLSMTSPRTMVQCTRVSFMAMRWTD